jgi:hypothetical protein
LIDIIGRWATMGHVWYMWSCYERDFKIASTTILYMYMLYSITLYTVYPLVHYVITVCMYICTLYTYMMMYCMYMLGGTF